MQGKGRPPGHRRLGANSMPGPTAELRLQPPGPRERNFYRFRGLRPAVLHYGGPQTRRSSPHLKVLITSAEFLLPHKRTHVQVPGTGTQTSLPPTLLTTWSCTGPWGSGSWSSGCPLPSMSGSFHNKEGVAPRVTTCWEETPMESGL